MDDSALSNPPLPGVEGDSVVPQKQGASISRSQGMAIICLLSAILVVAIIILVLLVRRRSARRYLDGLRAYLVSRAHQAAQLSSKELDQLAAKRGALRLDALEPRLGELLEAPRTLIKRL